MLLGVIADDFTGGSDIANTLSREGMRTRLFVGAAAIDASDVDAGVVALKTRTIDAAEAIGQSLDALDHLRAAGCRQFVFKYCSTFDSTPKGNIGPVAEALARQLGARGVVVCPAFPATGRTVYQGHLFVSDRLLSRSGMERHPLTPMTDPDLRAVLTAQCTAAPGHINHAIVRGGSAAIAKAIAIADAELLVVDAVSDDDLRAIGAAVADAPLITGASGIALGLPDNFRRKGVLATSRTQFRGNNRPALIIAGSCSGATQDQVTRFAVSHPAFAVDAEALIDGSMNSSGVRSFLQDNAAHSPMIYSTAKPEAVAAAQARFGTERAASAIETFFGEVASIATEQGFGRIVVAGGETSGAVVTALGLDALDLGPEIAHGVPAMSSGPLAIALKSGNFGGPDFFETAIDVLRDG